MDLTPLSIDREVIQSQSIGVYEIDPYFLSQYENKKSAIEATLSLLKQENPEYSFQAKPTKHGGVRVIWTRREEHV